MIHGIRYLAGGLALATASLAGCIMLPPPMPYGPPPPGFRGEGPPRSSFDAHRPPPPMAAWDMCDGQPEGARPALPGPRADAFTGTCERAPSGELQFRPSGPR
jgi:hypothetical protein